MDKSTKKKNKEVPPEPKKERSNFLWAAIALVMVGAIAWTAVILVKGAHRRDILLQLPQQPDLSQYNETLRNRISQAEDDLRDGPLGPGLGNLGNLYMANYFYDQAAACYELAVQEDPKNAHWPYLLAYVRSMMGNTPGSMPLFDEAIERNPDYVPARLRRADNLYKNGDLDGAQRDYEHCTKLEPANVYAALGLARIALDRKEWERAESILQNALKDDPAFGNTHRLMAEVLDHYGRTKERDRELQIAENCGRFVPAPDPWVDEVDKELCFQTQKLLTKGYVAEKNKDYDLAQFIYERIIRIEPDNFDANFRLATVLQAVKERDKAEALYQRALKLKCTDTSRYTVIYSNLGEIYYQKGDAGRAVECLNKALELDPDFFAAHLSLGAILTKLGKPDEAIKHCQKALEIEPKADGAHYNWGAALLKEGKIEEAMAQFQAAVQLNPDLAVAHYQIGVYHLRNGDMEAAAQSLHQALVAAQKTGNRALAQRIQQMLARAAA